MSDGVSAGVTVSLTVCVRLDEGVGTVCDAVLEGVGALLGVGVSDPVAVGVGSLRLVVRVYDPDDVLGCVSVSDVLPLLVVEDEIV